MRDYVRLSCGCVVSRANNLISWCGSKTCQWQASATQRQVAAEQDAEEKGARA